MRKMHATTVMATMLVSLAIAPAALAQPPDRATQTYESVSCEGYEDPMDLHIAGSIRLWDDDGNSYLLREAEQTMSIYDEEKDEYTVVGPFGRSWGQGADTRGAIFCSADEPFELQGFRIESLELWIVPLS
jgi:hypothetical protein